MFQTEYVQFLDIPYFVVGQAKVVTKSDGRPKISCFFSFTVYLTATPVDKTMHSVE
jgi:hypothetical protein